MAKYKLELMLKTESTAREEDIFPLVGETEDIARVAVWLASDDSDYINGTSIFVDGGMTLYPGFATGG